MISLGMVLQTRGLCGHVRVGESCRHGSQAQNRSHAIVEKWAMGTVLMLHHIKLGMGTGQFSNHVSDSDHEAE